MELHRFNEHSKLLSCGPTDVDSARHELRAALVRAEQAYPRREEWMANCCLSVSRSRKDWLGFNCQSATQVHVLSDRLVMPTGFWARLFENKRSIAFFCSPDRSEVVLRDYMFLDRAEFEHKYEAGYTNGMVPKLNLDHVAA